jgi:hypothetical protein
MKWLNVNLFFLIIDNRTIESLMDRCVLASSNINETNQWLTARVVCNLFAFENGGNAMLQGARLDKIVELVNNGLASSVSQYRHVS